MNIEANTKTATKYLVYTCDEGVTIETYDDLASARGAAFRYALDNPGSEFHVAAHMTTFRAETVVKEV